MTQLETKIEYIILNACGRNDLPDDFLPWLRKVMTKEFGEIATDLAMWQRFASYCRCCAQCGEHDPDDFETFKVRTGEPVRPEAV